PLEESLGLLQNPGAARDGGLVSTSTGALAFEPAPLFVDLSIDHETPIVMPERDRLPQATAVAITPAEDHDVRRARGVPSRVGVAATFALGQARRRHDPGDPEPADDGGSERAGGRATGRLKTGPEHHVGAYREASDPGTAGV